jgi:hypothetical protein
MNGLAAGTTHRQRKKRRRGLANLLGAYHQGCRLALCRTPKVKCESGGRQGLTLSRREAAMGGSLYKHGLDVVAILNPASPALVREALAVLVAVEAGGMCEIQKG